MKKSIMLSVKLQKRDQKEYEMAVNSLLEEASNDDREYERILPLHIDTVSKHKESIRNMQQRLDCILMQYNIPEAYQNDFAISHIAELFEKQRADSFKEAYNIYDVWNEQRSKEIVHQFEREMAEQRMQEQRDRERNEQQLRDWAQRRQIDEIDEQLEELNKKLDE